MWNFGEECSHIINIYEKQGGNKEKGNLFLSGVYSLGNPESFQKYNINCVFTIMDQWTYKSFKVIQKLKRNQVQHTKWIDLQDMQDVSIYPYLDEAHTYIKSMLQKCNVLVHCQMGMSRSSSLVIAFLMKQYGMDYAQARSYAKKRRGLVNPNSGFEKELKQFQDHLRQEAKLFKK